MDVSTGSCTCISSADSTVFVVVCTVLLYMLLPYTCPFNDCSIDSTYTVEEAVEKLGFGSFQLLVTVFSGLLWVSD